MTRIDPHEPLGRLVAAQPARARVFERLGLDYCCGGKTTLADAAAEKNLDLKQVLDELSLVERAPAPAAATDWRLSSLSALTEHIVSTHHVFLRRELPRLARLFDKVTVVHGGGHAELFEAQRVFTGLADELYPHMVKEETILFPLIGRLEGAGAGVADWGLTAGPVRVMLMEHDNAAVALHGLRELTSGFSPPEDACESYRALLGGLADLEADTHMHIHLENNILFPRLAAAADHAANESR